MPAGRPMADNTKTKSSWGGHRPGSGRKKGQLNESTLERIRVLEEYKSKVREVAEQLFEKQLELALKGDRQVIDSMLDRAFGRPESSLDVTSKGERLGLELTPEQAAQLIRARASRSDS